MFGILITPDDLPCDVTDQIFGLLTRALELILVSVLRGQEKIVPGGGHLPQWVARTARCGTESPARDAVSILFVHVVRNLYFLRRFGRPVSVQQNQRVASDVEWGLLEQRLIWIYSA